MDHVLEQINSQMTKAHSISNPLHLIQGIKLIHTLKTRYNIWSTFLLHSSWILNWLDSWSANHAGIKETGATVQDHQLTASISGSRTKQVLWACKVYVNEIHASSTFHLSFYHDYILHSWRIFYYSNDILLFRPLNPLFHYFWSMLAHTQYSLGYWLDSWGKG